MGYGAFYVICPRASGQSVTPLPKGLDHNSPFFAALCGSVRVMTPPRGSDRVRSTC